MIALVFKLSLIQYIIICLTHFNKRNLKINLSQSLLCSLYSYKAAQGTLLRLTKDYKTPKTCLCGYYYRLWIYPLPFSSCFFGKAVGPRVLILCTPLRLHSHPSIITNKCNLCLVLRKLQHLGDA